MNVELLTSVMTVILALSVTSERLVEIVKGLVPWLNEKRPTEMQEGWRRSALQSLAVASAVLTAYLAGGYVKEVIKLPAGISETWAVLGLGLLASGGSGLWNSVLTYVSKVKDIKKQEVKELISEARAVDSAMAVRGLEMPHLKKA